MEYKYKVFVQEKFKNVDRIYPLQQKHIATLIDTLKKNDCVNKIIIFLAKNGCIFSKKTCYNDSVEI